MTTAQILQEALKTTVLGMGLVLGTLYVLSLILDLTKVIFAPNSNRKKSDVSVEKDQTIEIIGEAQTDVNEVQDDIQLVAVIAAALAQYLQTPVSNIKIGSIRKIHEKTPIWGMESRIYNINNRL